MDEAFANIYSTTMSVQNIAPNVDRRFVAVAIGVIATLLAGLLDFGQYQSFLFLIGSVFVPLFAMAAADFLLVSGQRWDVSPTSRLRWAPVVAWAGGFVAYQLVYPGTVPVWSDFWYAAGRAISFTPPTWLGSSVAAIAVSMMVMVVLGRLGRRFGPAPVTGEVHVILARAGDRAETVMRQAGAVVMIYAHRGYSAKEPEMTRAAYLAAIDWAERTGSSLGLETDVHFSADGQLICLHDLSVDRTSTSTGRAYERTLAELQTLDFGSWKVRRPSPEQRTLIGLAELLELTAGARGRGVDVSLAIETKHPNPRTTEVEDEVAALLEPYGWTAAGSPVRIISFFLPGLERAAEVLPELPRTLLSSGTWGSGGTGTCPRHRARSVPTTCCCARTRTTSPGPSTAGHEVHVWTVNRARDITWCLNRGVTGITTDDPAVAAAAVARWAERHRRGSPKVCP